MNGGVGKIEMLKKTNILALVGGGVNPCFSPKKIMIWDDHQGKIIRIIRFNKFVLNVRLTKEKIFGVTENKLYIMNLNTLETNNILDTYNNPNGLIGISDEDNDKLIIAYPIRNQGIVCFRNCINKRKSKDSKLLSAHESSLACISINKCGTLLATASDKGTLIRIFTIPVGENITAFRRGTKNVSMNCITFSPNNIFIGCSSDVGTIHIFSIVSITKKLNGNNKNENDKKNLFADEFSGEPKNQKSFLGKIGGFFKINNEFIDQERSFAKFRIPDQHSLLGFGTDNTITVITMEGKYYKAAYDPRNGGDCKKFVDKNFLVDL